MFFRGAGIQRHERGRCDLLPTPAFPNDSTELSSPVVIPHTGSLLLDLRSPLSTCTCRRREQQASSDHYPTWSSDQRFQRQVRQCSGATPCIQNQADPPVLKSGSISARSRTITRAPGPGTPPAPVTLRRAVKARTQRTRAIRAGA